MSKKERLLTEWGQKLFRGIQVALGGMFFGAGGRHHINNISI
jgi:hypothetical protein